MGPKLDDARALYRQLCGDGHESLDVEEIYKSLMHWYNIGLRDAMLAIGELGE